MGKEHEIEVYVQSMQSSLKQADTGAEIEPPRHAIPKTEIF